MTHWSQHFFGHARNFYVSDELMAFAQLLRAHVLLNAMLPEQWRWDRP